MDNTTDKTIDGSNVNPEEVKEFLKNMPRKEGLQPNIPDMKEADSEEERIEAPRDKVFDQGKQPPQGHEIFNQGERLNLDKVTVTDGEKESYLKSVLFDKSFETLVSLFGGRCVMKLRSRSKVAQETIFQYLRQRGEENQYKMVDLMADLQKAYVVTSLRAIGESESKLQDFEYRIDGVDEWEKDKAAEDRVKVLSEAVDKLAGACITGPRWQAIIDAFNVFGKKEQLLSEMVLNEDF